MQDALVAAGAAAFTWATAGSGCSYDLYEDTDPTFSLPGTTTYAGVTATHVVENRLGDPATNYFFVLRATCTEGVYDSNQVGAFDFALQAGN